MNNLEMRKKLKYHCVYSGPKWERKVDLMSEQQVYRVYTDLKKKGMVE